MMPRMTGFEVAQKVREDFSANQLPILLVTAKNQVSDLVEGLSSGANDYLSKPFSKPELLARVRTHLNLSRAHTVEAENQRKSEEMKQARAIQLSLLPTRRLPIPTSTSRRISRPPPKSAGTITISSRRRMDRSTSSPEMPPATASRPA